MRTANIHLAVALHRHSVQALISARIDETKIRGKYCSQLAALQLFRLFLRFGIDGAFSLTHTIFSWDAKFPAYYFSLSNLSLLASCTLLVVSSLLLLLQPLN